MKHTLFLLTFILFFGFAQASEQSCISVFGARQFPGTIAEDSLGKSHFQFGLEIEYTLGDSQALLRHYMPDPEFFPMSKDEWMGMSFVEKLEFIQANEKSLFPDYRNEGMFVRTHKDPGYNYLPESFLLDGKNFELRLGPMDSYEEFIHASEYITKRAGIGSMQANTSVSHKSFFAGENSAELNLGYFKAIQEHDTLEKLIKGYQRLQNNPDVLAAKSFNHKWLGPSDSTREHKLEVMLTQNSMDQFYGMGGVSSTVDSHKFIGGTVYRPDVARQSERIINEVRDCHKSLDCIKNRVERTIEIHKEGKERFLEAVEFKAFDKTKALEDLIKVTRKTAQNKRSPVSFMLEELFEADPRLKALKVGANFSYPFRDWQGHIKLLSKEAKASGVDLQKSITAAQSNYAKKLMGIEQQYNAKKLSPDEAIQKVQAALVEYAHESKVYPALKSWLNPKTIKKIVTSKTVELEPVLVKSEIVETFEKIKGVEKIGESGGVPMYKMPELSRFSAVEDRHYKSFVEDTVEVVYQDIEPFGHIYLRIGDERFTYNWIKKASTGKYSVDRVGNGNTGFVLKLNKEKMKELKEEVVAFYEDSTKYNVPPFDSYAPELEIHVEKKTGFFNKLLGSDQTLSYKSKSPKGGNTEQIGKKVKLVDDGDHAYLMTPEGHKYDVSKRGDRYFIQSHSCSSSATCVLNRFLGVEIDPKLGIRGAKHLKKVLTEKGKDHFVEAIIQY